MFGLSTVRSAMQMGSPVQKLRLGVAQMTSKSDIDANFRIVHNIFEKAKMQQVDLLCLPENFAFMGSNFKESLEKSEPLSGPNFDRYRKLCADYKMWCSFGGYGERVTTHNSNNNNDDDDDNNKNNNNNNNNVHDSDIDCNNKEHVKLYNAHVVVDSTGCIKAVYRKIHLFDVEYPVRFQESRHTEAGDQIVTVPTPWGTLGLTVCYDLRFPELYLKLREEGAGIILAPAAFTLRTGMAHWELLNRARAIDSQCFIASAAQSGVHNEKRESYGHACVVDPWGKVIAQAGEFLTNDLFTVDINVSDIEKVRKALPLMQHRKPELYKGK